MSHFGVLAQSSNVTLSIPNALNAYLPEFIADYNQRLYDVSTLGLLMSHFGVDRDSFSWNTCAPFPDGTRNSMGSPWAFKGGSL